MRIHRLHVEGIGPYATRQELDFDELTANGLFLLTGPTGAGKTTVLDAVVFALYGTVPGARGADGKRERGARERIVSDLRALDTQPLVELEFSAGGRRFIVRRSPDHDRPKSRGIGTTVAKASATLEERIGGDWVPRSTDFREISIELEGVLGMSAAQFTQVVLLPQGEFAGFLRASVSDRRKVLERLFQVDRYDSAEDWFRARADLAKQSLAEAQAGLSRVVEHLAGALGDAAGPEELRRELSGPDEISAWVAARRLDADATVLEAEREAEDRRAAYAAADASHNRAVAIAELRAALDERERALHEHAIRLPNARAWMATQEGDAVAADDEAWDRVARAARGTAHALQTRVADERRLEGLREGAARAQAEADAAARAADFADEAVRTATGAIAPLRAAADDGARAEAAAEGLRRERAALVTRVDAAARRDGLAEEAARLAARLAAAADEASAADADLAAQPAEEALDARGADLASQQRDLTEMRAALESEIGQLIREADRVAGGRERVRELRVKLDDLRAESGRHQQAHAAARTAYLDAREARLSAMAAELAADLRPGEACAVCGSQEHPSPASDSASGDLRAAEAAAEAEASRRERELAAGQQALAECTGQLASLDPAELDARAADVTARSELRRGALTELGAEEQRLAGEHAALAAAITARRGLARGAAQARSAATAVEREATALREALATATAQAGDGPPPRDELSRTDAALAGLAGRIQGGAAARERITALEAEAEAARAASAERRGAVARHREAGRGQAEEAARIERELSALRGEHRSIEAAATAAAEHAYRLEKAADLLVAHQTATLEHDAAAAAFAERVATDVADPDEPDDLVDRIGIRGDRRTAAGEAATDAAAQLHQARVRLKAVREAETASAEAVRALGPAAEAAERLIRLDLTVRGSGDNLRKISLATYVLAARLEEVAAAATGHLLRMSSGRFELLHHDDRHGTGQAGLGLRVRDGWTGEERDTATLSGGEAFYASLSLALGLAEVVTQESGGRPLDTLLVDEGFGSLDPATLEEVLGELEQLRAAGRSIGLVSHVEALAERIPAQLQITPGRSGSTARVVVGQGTAAV